MNRSAFVVRMSNSGYHQVAKDMGRVVIGWAELDGLRHCDAPTRGERLGKIKNVLRKSNWYESERAIGAVASSLHRFIHEIRHQDYILYPCYKGFHIGEVNAEGWDKAKYDQSLKDMDCAWYWPVEWKKDSRGNLRVVPRDNVDNDIASFLKFQGTCCKIKSDSITELEKSVQRQSPLTISSYLRENDHFLDDVVKALQKSQTPQKLELLIKRMLEKAGAKVTPYPHGEPGRKGDVDLRAVFPVRFCGSVIEEDEFAYAYQIKRHVGKSDKTAVEQLVDRFEDIKSRTEGAPEFSKGIAVTTGEFDKEAIRCKDEFNKTRYEGGLEIVLVNGKQLAQWLIDSGIEDLDHPDDSL